MKIKIIDLLVKIANGEEVPKKIKYEKDTYIHIDNYCYYCEDTNLILSDRIFAEYSKLNDEVEIIEETNKIEKIKSNGDEFYSDYIGTWISKNKTDAYCEFLMNKINELIDEINNLKESD